MAELTKLHALSGKLHELQEEATKVDETFNEVALQHQQLERRSVVLQESLERHDAASHEKIAGLRTRTAKQQEQYEQLMAEREGFQAKQELKLKDCRKVTEAIEELTRQWNSELDVADAAFRELENDICKCHHNAWARHADPCISFVLEYRTLRGTHPQQHLRLPLT